MAELTPKQARFVEEYLVDLNGTQAAIRAGYSVRTANEQGSRLLANVSVAQAVGQAQAERSARLRLTQDRVLEELASLGFAKLGDYAEWGLDRFALIESSTVDTRAVQEVKVKETVLSSGEDGETILKREYGVKLHDKVSTLKLLGQHIGMFVDRHEHRNAPGEDFRVVVQPGDYGAAVAPFLPPGLTDDDAGAS